MATGRSQINANDLKNSLLETDYTAGSLKEVTEDLRAQIEILDAKIKTDKETKVEFERNLKSLSNRRDELVARIERAGSSVPPKELMSKSLTSSPRNGVDPRKRSGSAGLLSAPVSTGKELSSISSSPDLTARAGRKGLSATRNELLSKSLTSTPRKEVDPRKRSGSAGVLSAPNSAGKYQELSALSGSSDISVAEKQKKISSVNKLSEIPDVGRLRKKLTFVEIENNAKESQSSDSASELDPVVTNRIVVQNEDLAKKNDSILQAKLMEAKAMNRRDNNGATMFKFSLWSSARQDNSIESPSSELAVAEPKSQGLLEPLRGTLDPIITAELPINDSDHLKAHDNNSQPSKVTTIVSRFVSKFNQDFSKYASTTPSPAGSLVAGSDFVPLEKADVNIVNTEAARGSPDGMPSFLRNLVDNAKSLASFASQSSTDEITTLHEENDNYNYNDDEEEDEDEIHTNYDAETFATDNDDMLSILTGHTLQETDRRQYQDLNLSQPSTGESEAAADKEAVEDVPGITIKSEEEDAALQLVTNTTDLEESSISSDPSPVAPASISDQDCRTISPIKSSSSSAANTPIKYTRESLKFSWKKGQVIGEGSFGRVYKGINDSTGELIAVKQFCLLDGSEQEIESFQREIETMENLEHKNVVSYLGTDRTDKSLFILLEFVPGGSVEQMLVQFGAFSEDMVRRFTHHILSGVLYLHEKGIIHRDIKGANVLVSSSGVAKLADFGCSKKLAGMFTASLEESLKTIRGSVQWMAPEVIKQTGSGRSADIWSVGATVIEMASGSPPWSEFANNLATLFHVATSSDPPPFPNNLSDHAKELLKCCFVYEPSQRASAKELLLFPWFAGVDNQPIK